MASDFCDSYSLQSTFTCIYSFYPHVSHNETERILIETRLRYGKHREFSQPQPPEWEHNGLVENANAY